MDRSSESGSGLGDATGRDTGRRGQTTLDFAIGVSVFLAVVLFTFSFVPGILDPFTTGSQAETVTANRVADDLTQRMLGSPDDPNVLRTHCAVLFFDAVATGSFDDACGFEGGSLADYLGIQSHQNVNVTFAGNVSTGDDGTELLCWEADDERLVEQDGDGATDGTCDTAGDDVLLAAGGASPTANADSVRATRLVALAGEDVTVRVEMW